MAQRNAAPPYARIKQALKRALARGDYAPGAQLPSEAELVERFSVSRMTVGRALNELAAEGLVERRQGAGTFAASLHHVSSTLTLRDLHAEIEARGHRHSAEVKLLRAELPKPELAARFGISAGAPLFHSQILHFENGQPLQVEDRWVNPEEVPEYLQQDFTAITPTHYLFEVTALWSARYTIEAAAPSAREARWLGIERAAPCLVLTRETASRRGLISRARLVHPGGLYSIEGEFSP
jgi:GntR family transcriptional regulator, histidine utilization repressor